MTRDSWQAQRGFSLIETIAAMGVLAIAAIPLMQMTTTSVQHARSLETRMLARSVAENVLANAIAETALIDGGIRGGLQAQMGLSFAWTMTATPPQVGELQQISVSVTREGDPQVIAELVSLKLLPLPPVAATDPPAVDNEEAEQ